MISCISELQTISIWPLNLNLRNDNHNRYSTHLLNDISKYTKAKVQTFVAPNPSCVTSGQSGERVMNWNKKKSILCFWIEWCYFDVEKISKLTDGIKYNNLIKLKKVLSGRKPMERLFLVNHAKKMFDNSYRMH